MSGYVELKLEEAIKEALLALRWQRHEQGPNPSYFAGAGSSALKLEAHAASYVAHFITTRIADDAHHNYDGSPNDYLDKCSLEMIATYLEDHGYVVNSPE